MTLINIFDGELISGGDASPEFNTFLYQLKPLIESYTEHKQKAQLERMMIIGKISEYRNEFPQRSSDHKRLSQAMYGEGWTKDVIHNNMLSYKAYKEIMDGHSDYHPVAKKANVSQLQLIGRGELSLYLLLRYLRRNKKLPPVTALRGYIAGYFTDEFESKAKFRSGSREQSPNRSGLQVRHGPESKENYEYLGHTQAYVRAQCLYFLEQLDANDAFVNSEFREEIKKHHDKLNLLEDWSRPRRPRPTYQFNN